MHQNAKTKLLLAGLLAGAMTFGAGCQTDVAAEREDEEADQPTMYAPPPEDEVTDEPPPATGGAGGELEPEDEDLLEGGEPFEDDFELPEGEPFEEEDLPEDVGY